MRFPNYFYQTFFLAATFLNTGKMHIKTSNQFFFKQSRNLTFDISIDTGLVSEVHIWV